MKKIVTDKDLFAAQYTGSAAMMEGIREMLEGIGAPYLRGGDGRNIYTLLHTGQGDSLRQGVRQASLRLPGETLRIRWCMVADIDECPDHAYVRDGAFIYPDTHDAAIAWTGPWPVPEVREAVNAALEDFMDRLGGIPAMEGATVLLQAGAAQAFASKVELPGSQAQDDVSRGMNNEFFETLLMAHA